MKKESNHLIPHWVRPKGLENQSEPNVSGPFTNGRNGKKTMRVDLP